MTAPVGAELATIRRHRLPCAALRNSTTTSARNDAQQLSGRARRQSTAFIRPHNAALHRGRGPLPRALGITARDAPGETPPACRPSPRRDILAACGGARGRGPAMARSAANRVGGAARAARAGVPAAAVDVHRGAPPLARRAARRARAPARAGPGAARGRGGQPAVGDLLRAARARLVWRPLCSAAHAGAGKGLRGRRAVSAPAAVDEQGRAREQSQSRLHRGARGRCLLLSRFNYWQRLRALDQRPRLLRAMPDARAGRSALTEAREQHLSRGGERRPHEWWWR